MADLKYEIGLALLALIQVLTAYIQERRARDRYHALGRGLRKVQVSLHPPPNDASAWRGPTPPQRDDTPTDPNA